MFPADPVAPRRNAIATGFDNPVTTDFSWSRTAARLGAIVVVGRTLGLVGGFVAVVVAGAAVVGAVDRAACGELLLHAPKARVAPTSPNRSFRIEARLDPGAAYASSP
jgi:hypothetical protein